MSRIPRVTLRVAAALFVATGVGCSSAAIRHAAYDDGRGAAPEIVLDEGGATAADRQVLALVRDLCTGDTIRRTIARRRLAETGIDALPLLERLAEAAPVGSYRRRALVGAMESIHGGLDTAALAGEIRDAVGLRQGAAIRAAVPFGAPVVPALVDVVEAAGSVHRQAAIVALRRITLLHPLRRQADVAHAVRVWRAWHDATR